MLKTEKLKSDGKTTIENGWVGFLGALLMAPLALLFIAALILFRSALWNFESRYPKL